MLSRALKLAAPAGLACCALAALAADGVQPVGRITGLRLEAVHAADLQTLTTTSAVIAYVDGQPGSTCGLAISSTAAVVQPAPFAVDAKTGFPVSRQIGTFLKGHHQVVVTPAAVRGVPPCAGAAVLRPIEVR